jgi:hypothetical protein
MRLVEEEGRMVPPGTLTPAPGTAPPGTLTPAVTGTPARAGLQADRNADEEALFKEARRRQRRRRLATALAAATAATAAAAAAGAVQALHKPSAAAAGATAGTRTTSWAGMPAAPIAPGTSVAWADFRGHVHLGNVLTGAQRVVATSRPYPGEHLAEAGGRIFWVDHVGAYVRSLHRRSPLVKELDPATGRISVAGPGESVFPAPDGRHMFIAMTDTSLLEVTAGGPATSGPVTVPHGWFMPEGEAAAVQGGILVQSVYPLSGSTPQSEREMLGQHTLAVWNPATGTVRPVARDYQLISAAGPAGRDSLLAGLPASTQFSRVSELRITDVRTGATRLVRFSDGFGAAGAFSPDGRWLAMLVNNVGPLRKVRFPVCAKPGSPHPPGQTLCHRGPVTTVHMGGMAQLALIDTRTGALRLVPGTVTQAVALQGWVGWLPDGSHLVMGGDTANYLVDTARLTARPLFFMPPDTKWPYLAHNPQTAHYFQATQDMNLSTVVVPPPG